MNYAKDAHKELEIADRLEDEVGQVEAVEARMALLKQMVLLEQARLHVARAQVYATLDAGQAVGLVGI